MDDLVQYILEQVSFNGNLGCSFDRLWEFVHNYFASQHQEQQLDQNYKNYLWSLLQKCEDLVIEVTTKDTSGESKVENQHKNDVSLQELSILYQGTPVIFTTEDRQWRTLTGHERNSQEIPDMVFACLSAISRSREKGITLIDLYREVNQDKRSAPQRCKELAKKGLVRAFPVLAHKTRTTQYVHCRFLEENALYRAQQRDFGGQSRALDLHSVRLGISELLARSTNKILKVRDCCHLLNMSVTQTDKWTQRRFYVQVLLMADAGYIRRIRVPGKTTGTLILCMQLLKEYKETDASMLRKDRRLTEHVDDVENIPPDMADDEDGFQAKDETEDLDLDKTQENLQDPEITLPCLCRDTLLELQIYGAISQHSVVGVTGPELRRQLVGNHWTRPFDEQMKRVAPSPLVATQPGQYSSFAVSPPFEEVIGKVRQYRYLTRRAAWDSFGELDANCIPVSSADGKFPDIEVQEISSHVPPQPPANAIEKKRGRRPKASISEEQALVAPIKKRGRPRKIPESMQPLTIDLTGAQDQVTPAKKRGAQMHNDTPSSSTTANTTRKRRTQPGSRTPKESTTQIVGLEDVDTSSGLPVINADSAASPQAHDCQPTNDDRRLSPIEELIRLSNSVSPIPEGSHSFSVPAKRPLEILGTTTEYKKMKLPSITAPNGIEISTSRELPWHNPGVSPELQTQDASQTCKTYSSIALPVAVRAEQEHVSPTLSEAIPGQRNDATREFSMARRMASRKNITNTTSERRKVLLLELIKAKGGLAVLDVEFVEEYDRRAFAASGISQKADKKTLFRALTDLKDGGHVHWTVRAIPSHTGRSSVRKDLFFLTSIDPNGTKISDFVEEIKMKESRRANYGVSHKSIEIVPRPEMDIIPTAAQCLSTSSGLGPLKLSSDEMKQLRVRLAEKASKDDASKTDTWYKGKQRLVSHQEELAARKSQKRKPNTSDASLKVGMTRDDLLPTGMLGATAIRPMLRKGNRKGAKIHSRLLELTPAREHTSQATSITTSRPPVVEEHVASLPSRESELSAPVAKEVSESTSEEESQSKLPNSKAKRTLKKSISKRADRFEEEVSAKRQDELTQEASVFRRRHMAHSEEDDDTIIRAATLSMLFFSKSDLQPKIDWQIVTAAMPDQDEDSLKRRYAVIRSRSKHKSIQDFINSCTFAQFYNEAVSKNDLEPVPRAPISPGGTIVQIQPYINFSRQWDPARLVSLIDPFLPKTIDEFHNNYTITSSKSLTAWQDGYHSATSSARKLAISTANAFVVRNEPRSEPITSQADHITAGIKSLLLTPEVEYDAAKGELALLKYGTEEQIAQVVSKMMDTGLVVTTKGEGRRIPGRNYQLADRFFQRLKGTLPRSIMSDASAFDNQLSQECIGDRRVPYPHVAADGTAAATLELVLRGNVLLQQGEKHWGARGLVNAYAVRSIDSTVLDFELFLVRGPRQWSADKKSCVPEVSPKSAFWIDINGKIMEKVYSWTITMIFGHIIKRGRLSAEELLRLCAPALTIHELQFCLNDLTKGGHLILVDGLHDVSDHYYHAVTQTCTS